MKSINNVEKMLKHCLKQKIGITSALVVTFLITGAVSTPLEARDLRARNRITPAKSGPGMTVSKNGTDVINIVRPENGISHNKYEDFNVETGNNVIFNNSIKDGMSVTGGEVKKNPNLTNSADVILNEVRGNSASHLNGGLEVFGKRAALVVANENGINVNGAKFINTSAVTLSTGRVSVDKKKVRLDTSSNNSAVIVGEKGLTTDSKYLNIAAGRAEINGNINSADNMNTNINIAGGSNDFTLEDDTLKIESKKSIGNKAQYAVSGSEYGAMYGNNIFILSSDENREINYMGKISSKDKTKISSKGKVVSSDITAKNVEISSKKEINNTGKIKAQEDVELNAPLVKNISKLKGDAGLKLAGNKDKFLDRNRGAIYYDFHLEIDNTAGLENNLKLDKAEIEAGRDIKINNLTENGRFENISGDLKAGRDIMVKGDFQTKTLSKKMAVEEILSKIKVNLHWEHRSLVDNAYFNGDISMTNGSLTDALRMMTDSQNKEFYTALKQVKDPYINNLLNVLLGADWKTRETARPESEWNKGAAIDFYKGNSLITAGRDIKISGKNVSFGEGSAKNEKKIINIAQNSVESINSKLNSGENNKITAENIFVKADNFSNINTDMTAQKDNIISSEKNIDIKGAAVTGNRVSLEAGKEINLSSELGYTSEGKHEVIKKAAVQGKEAVKINSGVANLHGAEISSENLVKIDTENLNLKDINTINTSYTAELLEWGGVILKNHKYTKDLTSSVESKASVVKGDKVLINAEKGAEISGSLVTGNNKDSLIQITSSGDVNIRNANNINYSNFFSDARGKNENGVYKLVDIDEKTRENISIVGSKLKSEGDINIKAKNLTVISSEISAGKNLELLAEKDIKLLADLDLQKEKISNVEWGSGSVSSHTSSLSKQDVISTVITAGEKAVLQTKEDIVNQSSEISGGSVNITAGKDIVNDAKASTEHRTETNVVVGVGASGSVGFAGMGASGSANTLDYTAQGNTLGAEGILDKDSPYKDVHAKGEIYAELKVDSLNRESEIHKNNKITSTSGDVNLTAKGTADIGNTDITSEKNINIEGGKVDSSLKEDTLKEVKNEADIKLSAGIGLSNDYVTKLNNAVNDVVKTKDLVTDLKFEEIIPHVDNTVKEIKDLAESAPNITKDDIVKIATNQSLNVNFENNTLNSSESTGSSLNSKGEINVTGKDGNIILNNVEIQGNKVELDAKEGITLGAGEKNVHNEKNGFNVNVTLTENTSVNLINGANAKVGLGIKGEYSGSTDLTKESLNTKISAGEVKYNTENLHEENRTKEYYKDNRGAGIETNLNLGVSSNQTVTADGTVGVNVDYSAEVGKLTENITKNVFESMDAAFGAALSGKIDTTGQNLEVSFKPKEVEIKKDGQTVVHVPTMEDVIAKSKINGILASLKVFNK